MRRDLHFGKDDPLYFPQPFHSPIGHLAIIPVPSTYPDHDLALAWYQPSESRDFIVHHSSSELGLLKPELTQLVQQFVQRLVKDIIQCPNEVRNDSSILLGRDSINRLSERLELPPPREEMFLRLACVQRQYLELYARYKWLVECTPHLMDVDRTYDVDRCAMGAFVEDLDLAAQLFRVGIPVWLVRSVQMLPGVRIDALADPIDEDAFHHIPIRDSAISIDASDASPPH
ncbi:hypothetical protein VKT23_011492 [Stygiomarasmius scandens]|uniref:Uncharacterized protein n=1 Tax=Marasmiellus scandens TaxID=2682957 RepID=A0ABR1J9A5_9AGAR